MADLLPIGLWKSALMSPKETFAKEKQNASIMAGAKQLVVGGAIAGLIMGLVGLLFGNVFGLVLMPITYAIALPIASLVITAIFWVIAKLLGGKGSYSQQFYLSAIFGSPFAIINSILSIIPIIGWLALLPVGLYGLYLTFLAVREVHQLSTMRTIVVIFAPGIIVFALFFLAKFGFIGLA